MADRSAMASVLSSRDTGFSKADADGAAAGGPYAYCPAPEGASAADDSSGVMGE